jgi:putative ABC transport system permease protein
MPDWKTFVADRLHLTALEEKRQRDLVDEVASQIEDLYMAAREDGKSETEAFELASSHIEDWSAFGAELAKADRMHRRSAVDLLAERSEESRQQRSGLGIDLAAIVRDIAYSLRGLRNSPGFTLVALLTLALGIGGTTTIFTFFDQVLLRPLPYAESERLVALWEKMQSFENASVSFANFVDWKERNRVFEHIGVWNQTNLNLTGSGDPREIAVARVSASLFPMLGVEPVLGRRFLPEEDRIGGSPVVILSHGFWQTHLGGDTAVLGQALTLDGVQGTVVGVMPPDFRYPPNMPEVDVYAPVGLFAERWAEQRGNHPGLAAVARLRPGVSIESARDDMQRIALELEAEHPDTNTGSRVHVVSLKDRITRGTRDFLVLLFLSVGVLLLIACINVANLVLARNTSRMHEMAIRASMGAGRNRLLRLLLTDSLVLWIVGGVLGVISAAAGVRVLSCLLVDEIPWVFQVALDLRVVGAALGVSLLTGLLFGLFPALRLSRQDPKPFLVDGVRTTGGLARARLRSFLVAAEVSLAVALLVGAGLAIRSFSNIKGAELGLEPSNVLSVGLNLPEASYPNVPERTEFFTRLLDAVRRLPGVVSASTSYVVPLGPGGWQNGFFAEGMTPEFAGSQPYAEVNSVSTGYFKTMGIARVSGRDFTRQDNADAPGVVIVDTKLAEDCWPNQNPLGKRIKWGKIDSGNPWMEVVGVVDNVMVNGVLQRATHQLYIPHWQDNDNSYYLMVKTRRDPLGMVAAIRREVLALDPNQPLGTIGTMEDWEGDTTRSNHLTTLLMAVFSGAAILLAAVGVYGVMAQLTAERDHEIGIRMALGARGEQILALVLRQGMGTVVSGVAVGVGLALFLSRVAASQLYQVSATDPLTFFLASILVALVAALANIVPARRAMTADPARVLHAE